MVRAGGREMVVCFGMAGLFCTRELSAAGEMPARSTYLSPERLDWPRRQRDSLGHSPRGAVAVAAPKPAIVP